MPRKGWASQPVLQRSSAARVGTDAFVRPAEQSEACSGECPPRSLTLARGQAFADRPVVYAEAGWTSPLDDPLYEFARISLDVPPAAGT
jgi:hypothetical protein